MHLHLLAILTVAVVAAVVTADWPFTADPAHGFSAQQQDPTTYFPPLQDAGSSQLDPFAALSTAFSFDSAFSAYEEPDEDEDDDDHGQQAQQQQQPSAFQKVLSMDDIDEILHQASSKPAFN
ncbi:hypothetical protein RI367_002935 [Sorochytrium milnesiophthora]